MDWAHALETVGVTPLPGDRPFSSPRSGVTLPGTRFAGTLDGKRIEVVLGSHVDLRVPLDPPLDLGLGIEPEGVLPRGTPPTGIRALDALYTVLADEPARARALVTPKVAEALVALLGRSTAVAVRDDVVSIRGEGEAWLRMAAPLAVEIAHRIDDARSAIPVPASLTEHRAALGRLAAARTLYIDDSPIRLGGASGVVRVQAVVRRVSHGTFVLDATLTLEGSLNLDLHLAPAGLLTPLRALLPGQTDHRVGDPELDAAFHVRTSAPEALTRALDAEARQTLIACASAARSVVVEDSGLRLSLPLRDDAAAEPAGLLAGCMGLLERLSAALRRAPAAPPAGPFR